MKIKLLIIFLSYLVVSRAGCNDKDVQISFPRDLRPEKRDKFVERWTEGESIFKENCARCHGVFKRGKDSIPNFSQKQIQNYGALFVARDAKNHAVMQQVSSEDFYKVILFISYIKRQGEDSIPPTMYQMHKIMPYGFVPNDEY